MTFKEFFVQHDFTKGSESPLGDHENLLKQFIKPEGSPVKNVLKGPKVQKAPTPPRSPVNPNSQSPLKKPAPKSPIEFLKRGSGLAPTTGKGFQI